MSLADSTRSGVLTRWGTITEPSAVAPDARSYRREHQSVSRTVASLVIDQLPKVLPASGATALGSVTASA